MKGETHSLRKLVSRKCELVFSEVRRGFHTEESVVLILMNGTITSIFFIFKIKNDDHDHVISVDRIPHTYKSMSQDDRPMWMQRFNFPRDTASLVTTLTQTHLKHYHLEFNGAKQIK